MRSVIIAGLPVLVYIPLLITSRLVVRGPIPPWVDWLVLFACAALILVNPWLGKAKMVWARTIVALLGFALWALILYFVTFWVMRVVFSEAL